MSEVDEDDSDTIYWYDLPTIDLARAGRSWTALFAVAVSLTAGLLALALGQAVGGGIAGG